MANCFFTSDLHGKTDRYDKLFDQIRSDKPKLVLLGGDLLPSGLHSFLSDENIIEDFFNDYFVANLSSLKNVMKDEYPEILLILGNDDGKLVESDFSSEPQNLWNYIHNKYITIDGIKIFGYSYIPPTPFILKDWEKYDVSRYVDPGCVSPEDGKYTVHVNSNDTKYSTIEKDLANLVEKVNLDESIFLFHSPPYKTNLDRAALDGEMIDHVPLDVNVGSIAIRRFIESKQPTITLHGHVHESARITGTWKDKIGKTHLFTAAHDDQELALVKFDINSPEDAVRTLL